MESIKFKDFYIGTPDGETEAKNNMFEELFYNSNNKYSELMSGYEKFMVVGSKGSGKTYLANYICKKAIKGQKRKIVDSKIFWLDKLTNIDTTVNDSSYIYALCKWFILNQLGNCLLEKHELSAKYNIFCSKHRLYKFMKQYENDEIFKSTKSITTNFRSKEKGSDDSLLAKNASELAVLECSATSTIKKQTTQTISVEAERKKFYELINTFEKKICDAITPKDDITLIFDDLDELDKKLVDNPSDNDIIINIIKIVKSYNNDFYTKRKQVKLILLIRTDILNKLQKFDTNLSKIKASCGVELYWIASKIIPPESHPLMSMVLHKIKASCPELKEISNKYLYNKLFPEKIDGKRPLDYLLDYSFGRPRDIVTHLNHVKQNFPDNSYFTAKAFKEIRKLYASDFYDELLNETYFHENPEYTQQCMNLISGLKRVSFTYELLEDHYQENRQMFPEIEDLKDAVSFLYRIGVIGNVWTENDKKTHSSWAYRKDSMDEVDFSKKFTIHYALRKKFSL